MPTTVDIESQELVKYLQIAAKQRKRALAKFTEDYGPGSATVKECGAEIARLDMAINKLLAEPTPIEKAIQRK